MPFFISIVVCKLEQNIQIGNRLENKKDTVLTKYCTYYVTIYESN